MSLGLELRRPALWPLGVHRGLDQCPLSLSLPPQPQEMRGWTPGTGRWPGRGAGGGACGLRLSPPAAVPHPSSPWNSGIVGRWLCLSKPQCFMCKRERKFSRGLPYGVERRLNEMTPMQHVAES